MAALLCVSSPAVRSRANQAGARSLRIVATNEPKLHTSTRADRLFPTPIPLTVWWVGKVAVRATQSMAGFVVRSQSIPNTTSQDKPSSTRTVHESGKPKTFFPPLCKKFGAMVVWDAVVSLLPSASFTVRGGAVVSDRPAAAAKRASTNEWVAPESTKQDRGAPYISAGNNNKPGCSVVLLFKVVKSPMSSSAQETSPQRLATSAGWVHWAGLALGAPAAAGRVTSLGWTTEHATVPWRTVGCSSTPGAPEAQAPWEH